MWYQMRMKEIIYMKFTFFLLYPHTVCNSRYPRLNDFFLLLLPSLPRISLSQLLNTSALSAGIFNENFFPSCVRDWKKLLQTWHLLIFTYVKKEAFLLSLLIRMNRYMVMSSITGKNGFFSMSVGNRTLIGKMNCVTV